MKKEIVKKMIGEKICRYTISKVSFENAKLVCNGDHVLIDYINNKIIEFKQGNRVYQNERFLKNQSYILEMFNDLYKLEEEKENKKMKTINIEIESFGLVANIFGTIIYENDKLFNLENAEITRSNGKKEEWKTYAVPKCYITQFEIN